MRRATHKALLIAVLWMLTPLSLKAQDLQMPAWTYCTPPGAPRLACFTPEDVQQLLRLQAAAQYGVRLQELQLSLEARTATLVTALEGASTTYAGLQTVIAERNLALTSELIEAQADAERYRGRLERRRVWPWVTLGLGLVTGFLGGFALSR